MGANIEQDHSGFAGTDEFIEFGDLGGIVELLEQSPTNSRMAAERPVLSDHNAWAQSNSISDLFPNDLQRPGLVLATL